jgi:ribosomal protein L29
MKKQEIKKLSKDEVLKSGQTKKTIARLKTILKEKLNA